MKKVFVAFALIIAVSGLSIIGHVDYVSDSTNKGNMEIWAVDCETQDGIPFVGTYMAEKQQSQSYEEGLCKHLNDLIRDENLKSVETI